MSISSMRPPLESRDFAQFVSACVERYGGVIDAYQIWDEPNIHPHWGSRYVSAEEYVGLLREGAIQVRAGDPAAWVLAGGLAPNTEPAGLNQNDLDFLREMYAAGAAEWFDALAAKALWATRAGRLRARCRRAKFPACGVCCTKSCRPPAMAIRRSGQWNLAGTVCRPIGPAKTLPGERPMKRNRSNGRLRR